MVTITTMEKVFNHARSRVIVTVIVIVIVKLAITQNTTGTGTGHEKSRPVPSLADPLLKRLPTLV
jgi:hypothetical protein